MRDRGITLLFYLKVKENEEGSVQVGEVRGCKLPPGGELEGKLSQYFAQTKLYV